IVWECAANASRRWRRHGWGIWEWPLSILGGIPHSVSENLQQLHYVESMVSMQFVVAVARAEVVTWLYPGSGTRGGSSLVEA
ncbi:hypothetical protein Tco_0057260, partial [Tanacetum coccineum]